MKNANRNRWADVKGDRGRVLQEQTVDKAKLREELAVQMARYELMVDRGLITKERR